MCGLLRRLPEKLTLWLPEMVCVVRLSAGAHFFER